MLTLGIHDECQRDIGMLQDGRTWKEVANVFSVSVFLFADFGTGFCKDKMFLALHRAPLVSNTSPGLSNQKPDFIEAIQPMKLC